MKNKLQLSQKIVESLLEPADIVINGSRPWDIEVRDERLFTHILTHGSSAIGTSYVDGWWECEALDELTRRALESSHLFPSTNALALPSELWNRIKHRVRNPQSPERSVEVLQKHYEQDEKLFRNMLDKHMQYSCAYFQNTDKIEEAQRKKLALIEKKLNLSTEDTLLDVGCGWGGLAKHAAQNTGCRVTGLNISQKQIAFAREFCKDLPVEFECKDYRSLKNKYSKIVSVGMFEHVGPSNQRTFMETISRNLSSGGVFLLQTITKNQSNRVCDPWISKNIFPNGHIPSPAQVAKSAENLLILKNAENIGAYYDKTLLAWQKNFEKAWPSLQDAFGESFHRMWNFYLLTCAGAFRANSLQCHQFVFFKK